MGSGAIALSSRDTDSGASADRDEAISQAVVRGAAVGRPVRGLRRPPPRGGRDAGRPAGGLPPRWQLPRHRPGDDAGTTRRPGRREGATGTGDTRAPMYVDIVVDGLNIVGSTVLGVCTSAPRGSPSSASGSPPRARRCTAVVLLAAFATDRAGGAGRPDDPVVAKQLLRVSAPSVPEGLVSTLAEFPRRVLGAPGGAGRGGRDPRPVPRAHRGWYCSCSGSPYLAGVASGTASGARTSASASRTSGWPSAAARASGGSLGGAADVDARGRGSVGAE